MQIAEIQKEGRLKCGENEFPVYRLADGRRAVAQSPVYLFMTGKQGKRGVRQAFRMSNLVTYLPELMLSSPEIIAEIGGQRISLLLSDEWVSLCNAVISANLNGVLGKAWISALPGIMRLLMAFARAGVDKTIDKAIANHPPVTVLEFDVLVAKLLAFDTGKVKAAAKKE